MLLPILKTMCRLFLRPKKLTNSSCSSIVVESVLVSSYCYCCNTFVTGMGLQCSTCLMFKDVVKAERKHLQQQKKQKQNIYSISYFNCVCRHLFVVSWHKKKQKKKQQKKT